LIILNHESGNWNALVPRGHFLLSSHKRKQKEPWGDPRDPRTALRQREALMHVGTRSARRPKTRCLTALKQFGRSFLAEGQAKQRLPFR